MKTWYCYLLQTMVPGTAGTRRRGRSCCSPPRWTPSRPCPRLHTEKKISMKHILNQCCGIRDVYPGSKRFPDPGSAKNWSILSQKKLFLSPRKYDPVYPGVEKAPDPGSPTLLRLIFKLTFKYKSTGLPERHKRKYFPEITIFIDHVADPSSWNKNLATNKGRFNFKLNNLKKIFNSLVCNLQEASVFPTIKRMSIL